MPINTYYKTVITSKSKSDGIAFNTVDAKALRYIKMQQKEGGRLGVDDAKAIVKHLADGNKQGDGESPLAKVLLKTAKNLNRKGSVDGVEINWTPAGAKAFLSAYAKWTGSLANRA